jgi:hypothetical protein
MPTLDQWRLALVSAVTADDVKVQKREAKAHRYHPPYALALQIGAIQKAVADPKFLSNPRKALANHFTFSGEIYGAKPDDFSTVKFSRSWLNAVLRKMEAK